MMRIARLAARGFRSLRNVSWEPGNLNALIGPNGSGKTNLVLLLKLIARSARGELGDFVLRAGGIAALLWDRRAEELSLKLETKPDGAGRDRALQDWRYSLRLVPRGREGFYQVQQENLKHLQSIDFLARGASSGQVLGDKREWIRIKADADTFSPEETLLAACGGPFPRSRDVAAFQNDLAGWAIYDPLHADPDSKVREPIVARAASRVDEDGGNLINVLHTQYTGNRQFKKDLDSAMRAAFGDEFEELVFPPAADQRIQLRVRWKSLESEVSAADLSAGTLRFLFLITLLAMPEPPPLIVIEEPERGLHPAMLPIVAEHAVDAALRTQVVFTTHSPSFLDAFGETRPTTTVLESREGQTVMETLSEERLDYWLQAYTLGKLFTSGVLEGDR
jgi:predicted ATPase